MKQNEVKRIVPAMMLFEGVRDQLEEDGLLRPIARNTDHIWQQMTSEHFEQYLDSENLFMRAHQEYDDYDEKKIQGYLDTCYALPSDSSDMKILNERLSQIEKRMYISCWYSSEDLSDMVFREYSKNGIALGTDVGQLIRCLNEFLRSEEAGELAKDMFYVGNVQYIYHQQLMNEAIFENTQVLCPLFLKGVQFKVDSEFRVCVFRKEEAKYNSFIFVGKIPPRRLIRRVAFRADKEHLEVLDMMRRSENDGNIHSMKTDDVTADDITSELMKEKIAKTEKEIAIENLEMLTVNVIADQADKTTITDKVTDGIDKNKSKKEEAVDVQLMKTLESVLKKVGLEVAPGVDMENPRVENGFIIYELREIA